MVTHVYKKKKEGKTFSLVNLNRKFISLIGPERNSNPKCFRIVHLDVVLKPDLINIK